MAIATTASGTLRAAATALPSDIREMNLFTPRSAHAARTGLAVVLSTLVACAMHLPDVWWAGISGLMATQASAPASLRKSLMRIAGTLAGAALGLIAVSWLVYDQVALCLALLLMAALGILGVLVSPHGYAWLFCGITFSLVVLMSLNDPTVAFTVAAYRVIEVVIGTLVAILVALTLAPDAPEAAPAAPGWTDLLGARWPAVLHALRSGIAVAVLPFAWSLLYVPSAATMATTVAVVLAVPVLSDHPMDEGSKIVVKAIQRVLGCTLGGALSVALLALGLDALLPWLAALFGAVWLFVYLQSSTRGVGYIGTQAAMVSVMMLVQGAGPPDSMMPALDRFGGILAGLLTLLLVSFVVQPGEPGPAPAIAGEG